MFTRYQTQGLILKKEDRGEADQLFTVYTKDFGKIKILAKSVRKISSKLRPAADIFCLSEIEFVQGKAQKTLTDAVLLEKFKNLRQDLNRLKEAHLVAKAVDDSIPAPQSDQKIWEFLIKVFGKINDQKFPADNLKPFHKYFILNFRSLLGYGTKKYNVKNYIRAD